MRLDPKHMHTHKTRNWSTDLSQSDWDVLRNTLLSLIGVRLARVVAPMMISSFGCLCVWSVMVGHTHKHIQDDPRQATDICGPMAPNDFHNIEQQRLAAKRKLNWAGQLEKLETIVVIVPPAAISPWERHNYLIAFIWVNSARTHRGRATILSDLWTQISVII